MSASRGTAGRGTHRASTARQCALLLAVALSGCEPSWPEYPTFRGNESDVWFAYQVTVPDQSAAGLLPPFAAKAHAYGCGVDRFDAEVRGAVRTSRGGYSGVVASCDDGTIALVALSRERVRVGCAKPTTRERCDALLQRISDARQP